MSFKQYQSYKDSKIAWAGKIPMHWETIALKRIANLKSGDTISSDNIEDEGGYPVFGGNGLRGYTDSYTHEGDYPLIGRQGALCGNINYANGKFWASEHAVVVTPVQEVEIYWLGELLRAMNLNQYSLSAAQPGLSVESIKNLYVPVPSLKEQTIIAIFLKREISKIDELVEKQKVLIALLKEKRQALIYIVVTKGLDNKVQMKDSGVEWFGEVPEHWNVIRNKQLFIEVDDRNKNENAELLTVSHITGVTKRSEKNVNMFLSETLNGYKCCKQGDLVINTMWAWMGALGISPCEGVVSPSYNVYRPRYFTEFNPNYYDYLCRTLGHVGAIKARSTGVWESRLRLYPNVFLAMETCLPPLSEQTAIANFLDYETVKIDALITEAQHAIELLKERRNALISAVVTGKIDVRGLVEEVTV